MKLCFNILLFYSVIKVVHNNYSGLYKVECYVLIFAIVNILPTVNTSIITTNQCCE